MPVSCNVLEICLRLQRHRSRNARILRSVGRICLVFHLGGPPGVTKLHDETPYEMERRVDDASNGTGENRTPTLEQASCTEG